MILFSSKNRKRFCRSFTQQWHFGGLKMQTFENGFQSASFWKQYQYCLYLDENLSPACILQVCIVFLYKAASPTTGLECIIQCSLQICVNRDCFDNENFSVQLFSWFVSTTFVSYVHGTFFWNIFAECYGGGGLMLLTTCFIWFRQHSNVTFQWCLQNNINEHSHFT